jgi:hypothetical protein
MKDHPSILCVRKASRDFCGVLGYCSGDYRVHYLPGLKDVLSGRNTGHFIMFCMITNIYNKKTKGPTLMELFTAAGKLKKFF